MPDPVPTADRDILRPLLDRFLDGHPDVGGILDEYEARLTIDAHNRAAYLFALTAWREDVTARIGALEKRVYALEDGPDG